MRFQLRPGDVIIWKGENGTGARWRLLDNGSYKYLGGGSNNSFHSVGDVVPHLYKVGDPDLWDVEDDFEYWVREVRLHAGK